MITSSLHDVFGAGATQTSTTVTISKADLPTLTPSATNNGQELLLGLLLGIAQREAILTSPLGEVLEAPDTQKITYPPDQRGARMNFWRIVFEDQKEYVYTLDIWL